MPVRSGSGSGGEHEGENDARHTGTPQPPSHRRLPGPSSPLGGELATDPAALSALLPELERRLVASLLNRRGVDPELAREACQHAFVVFLDKHPDVESVEHAFAWLNIVAHRQVSKWQRRRRWIGDDEVPERLAPDVADSVVPRLLLEEAARALEQLRPDDREALLEAVAGGERGATRRQRNLVALHVHRARKRLRSKLEGWWALLPWGKWRRAATELPAAWSPALGVKMLTALVVGGAALLPAAPRPLDPAVAVGVDTPLVRPSQVAVRTEPPSAPDAHSKPAEAERTRTTTPPVTQSPTPPSPIVPAGPLDNRVEVDSPATHGPIEIETRPRRPGDNSLACWGNLIVVPDGCLPHPLRS